MNNTEAKKLETPEELRRREALNQERRAVAATCVGVLDHIVKQHEAGQEVAPQNWITARKLVDEYDKLAGEHLATFTSHVDGVQQRCVGCAELFAPTPGSGSRCARCRCADREAEMACTEDSRDFVPARDAHVAGRD